MPETVMSTTKMFLGLQESLFMKWLQEILGLLKDNTGEDFDYGR